MLKSGSIFIFRYAWLSFLVLHCLSCIDEIRLDIDNTEQYVIVDGVVSDEDSIHEIRLNYSPVIGVGNDNILVPISKASVILKDAQGGQFLFDEEVEDLGTYKGAFQVEQDVEYQLEITLEDGQRISSRPQKLPEPGFPMDTLDWDVIDVEFVNRSGNVTTREFVELYVTTPALPDNSYLRWRIRGEYQFTEMYRMAFNPRTCFVLDNPDFNNISIASSEDLNSNQLEAFPIVRTGLDERFHIAYAFHVNQYRIHKEEYDYWVKIRDLIQIEGTLFDPPPGIIKGNLIHETEIDVPVFGYFSMASSSFDRRFVILNRKGHSASTECHTRRFPPIPERCYNCLSISRSTLEWPEYWIY